MSEPQPLHYQQFHDIFFAPKSVRGVQIDHITGLVKFLIRDHQLLPNHHQPMTKIPVKLLSEAICAFQRGEDWAIPKLEMVDAVDEKPSTQTENLKPVRRFQVNQCCLLRNIYQQWLMGQVRAVLPDNLYQIDVPGFGNRWLRHETELLPICDPALLRTGDFVLLCDGDFKTTIYVEGQIQFIDHEIDHCIVTRLDGSRPYEGSIDEIVANVSTTSTHHKQLVDGAIATATELNLL